VPKCHFEHSQGCLKAATRMSASLSSGHGVALLAVAAALTYLGVEYVRGDASVAARLQPSMTQNGLASARPNGAALYADNTTQSACRKGDPLANAENAKWLELIQPCVAVHGTVTVLIPPRPWDDGDYQFDLKLDAGEHGLVNLRNVQEQHGDLVAEIVPADGPGCVVGERPRPITWSVIVWLRGYHYGRCTGAHVAPPSLGEHVTVIGAYVRDKYHGWMEIHPVWAIEHEPH
jgi:hypothetical protein